MDIRKEPGWTKYKRLYDRIPKARSDRDLSGLRGEVGDIAKDLDRAFAGQSVLVDRLQFILRDNLKHRHRQLNPPRGKPPRPDWLSALREAVERLAAEREVLGALRKGGYRDPWIEDRLVKEFRWYIGLVEQNIELAGKDAAAAGESPPEIENARRELEASRGLAASLGE
jgi:hypothetical protein